MDYPNNYRYTKEHEWAVLNPQQDGTVTVGITHHAQDSLGEVVFVELPKVGATLKAGDTFGVVESIKAVSDLYAPVSGTVTEINDKVVSEPGLLNQTPHSDAWLLKIKLSNPNELESLLSLDAYKKLIS